MSFLQVQAAPSKKKNLGCFYAQQKADGTSAKIRINLMWLNICCFPGMNLF